MDFWAVRGSSQTSRLRLLIPAPQPLTNHLHCPCLPTQLPREVPTVLHGRGQVTKKFVKVARPNMHAAQTQLSEQVREFPLEETSSVRAPCHKPPRVRSIVPALGSRQRHCALGCWLGIAPRALDHSLWLDLWVKRFKRSFLRHPAPLLSWSSSQRILHSGGPS